MNKAELIKKVKKNKLVYAIYYRVMSGSLNFLRSFVKTDDKLILFVAYGGRHFNDSPKCIYKRMLADLRFQEYTLVWAFDKPEKFDVPNKVKIDTPAFYFTALKARCWVTNTVVERGLHFRGKNTYYFHTTHGTLPKFSGRDAEKGVFGSDFQHQYDCSCAQSVYEQELQQSMYRLKKDQILVCGYPKNDVLTQWTETDRLRIREELGIAPEQTAVLYAPTYREDGSKPEVDFKKWKEILGDQFCVLFRAHPIIADKTELNDVEFVKNVSNYPDNMELMIASDVVVSDYSGIFFEYGILNRPMYCYAYDYDAYRKTRGMYMDLREELPTGTEDQILTKIKSGLSPEDKRKLESFVGKYITAYGNATNLAVDNIYNHIC